MSTTPEFRRCPRKHELAEIFVLGEEQSPFSGGKRDDFLILRATHRLADGNDIVAGGPKPGDQVELATFVRDQPHESRADYSINQRS